MSKKTRKPQQLGVTRTGGSFKLTWKKAETYVDQTLAYKIWNKDTKKGKKGTKKPQIGPNTTSYAFKINFDKYYPKTKKLLRKITFTVKAKANKKGWNKSKHTWKFKKPPQAKITTELTNASTTKFTWTVDSKNDGNVVCTDTRWQAILVKDMKEGVKPEKLKWNSNVLGWAQSGNSGNKYTAGLNSNKSFTEDSALFVGDYSYTRWFRIMTRGPYGKTGWAYEHHTYAKPTKAEVLSCTADLNEVGGCNVDISWQADQTTAHPIDETVIQYAVAQPQANMSAAGAQWNDVPTPKDTKDEDALSFQIDEQPTDDMALFVRVNTKHDNNTTYGTPQVPLVGSLAEPTLVSVDTVVATHRATITVTNNSNVPDSFIAVRYKTSKETIIVGIIPHGGTSVTVQCPNWGTESPSFSAQAYVGSYEKQQRTDNVDVYTLTRVDMSSVESLGGGDVPKAPTNVSVHRTNVEGTVEVTWDWNWSSANGVQLAWSDHADAWESTDEPQTYEISNLHAGKWHIADLEVGIDWYIRVRFFNQSGDSKTYGPWSSDKEGIISLSSAPSIPVLQLSNPIIPASGKFTASWVYVSTDTTPQEYAVVYKVVSGQYIEIAHTSTAQTVEITPKIAGMTNGNTYALAVRVKSKSGRWSEYSDPVSVAIATPLTCSITQKSLVQRTITETYIDEDTQEEVTVTRTPWVLEALPMTVTVSGAEDGGTTVLAIERTADYEAERPDGLTDVGYEGETVFLAEQTGDGSFEISDPEQLYSQFDDGAKYQIVATVYDGLGQKDEEILPFEVYWTEQAKMPTGTVVVDGNIVKITPTAPANAGQGSWVDIYRLSADRPELIVQNAEYGVTYVDPFPALNALGGHRLVYYTKNGDYTIGSGSGSDIAWRDFDEDDGDIIESNNALIDFGEEQIELEYGLDYSSKWEKDFTQTSYLGGSVQGDWNRAVTRTGELSTAVITEVDMDKIAAFRRLATFPEICHIRTPDGSSYAADIQVAENRQAKYHEKIVTFTLTITRVDPDEEEGMTLAEWNRR